ncbi:MAG: hypothetical protein DCC55_25065 [Chloroflexi bacterium]|nr:MAG: hypothetical protein DCC55_25065 [Chloroflexota bacterium]
MTTETTPSPADSERRAQKRTAIGLAPNRPTAQNAPRRPPIVSEAQGCLWSLVLLVAALIVVTLLLTSARLIDSPTSWPQVRSLAAGWFGAPAQAVEDDAFRLLLGDEFTHADSVLPFADQPGGWSLGVVPGAGVYRLRVQPDRLGWSTVGIQEAVTFYAEVSFTISEETPNGVAGLVVRQQTPGTSYLFAINGQGEFQAQLLQQGSLQALTPWLPDMALNQAGAANVLAVEDDGEMLRFFVNSILFFEVGDPQLPSGDLGVFGAAPPDSAAEVDVDWLHLYALPPG